MWWFQALSDTHGCVTRAGYRQATGAIRAPKPATVEGLAAALVDGLRNMDPKPLGPFNGHERHDGAESNPWVESSPAPALTNEVISDGVFWDASISR